METVRKRGKKPAEDGKPHSSVTATISTSMLYWIISRQRRLTTDNSSRKGERAG